MFPNFPYIIHCISICVFLQNIGLAYAFLYFFLLESETNSYPNTKSHAGESNRNFGKGLAVPGDQLGFLAKMETKEDPSDLSSVSDDFEKLVHLVGHPGESYIIYIWHEACWTDKSSTIYLSWCVEVLIILENFSAKIYTSGVEV